MSAKYIPKKSLKMTPLQKLLSRGPCNIKALKIGKLAEQYTMLKLNTNFANFKEITGNSARFNKTDIIHVSELEGNASLYGCDIILQDLLDATKSVGVEVGCYTNLKTFKNIYIPFNKLSFHEDLNEVIYLFTDKNFELGYKISSNKVVENYEKGIYPLEKTWDEQRQSYTENIIVPVKDFIKIDMKIEKPKKEDLI